MIFNQKSTISTLSSRRISYIRPKNNKKNLNLIICQILILALAFCAGRLRILVELSPDGTGVCGQFAQKC